MNGPAVARRAAHDRETADGELPPTQRQGPVHRDDPEPVSVLLVDDRVDGLAQSRRAPGDGVEDRLHVRLRLADHPEDLGGGGLLIQRVRQVTVARLELLEETHVLDRDDRLVGEGLEQGDLALGEGPRLGAANADHADGHAFSHQGDAEYRAMAQAPRGLAALRELVLANLYVGHVNGPPVEDGSAVDRPPDHRDGRRGRDGAVMGDEVREVPVSAEHGGVQRVAQASGTLRDRVEHRLDVGRRARDDAQDLGGRRLLLQGLGEVGVPGLELAEQPRVLDGDGRLIREGGDEIDLLVGERANLHPPQEDHADQLVLLQHGDGQHRSVAADPPRLDLLPLGVGQGVEDVERPALEGGPTDCGAASRPDHVPLPELAVRGGSPVLREEPEHLAVEPRDEGPLGPGQPGRVLDQGLEHRLQIERRAADHLEHFAGRGLLLQGEPQLGVPRLQLGEQADVLDRDHRLVGEGLEQRHLPLAEEASLGATEGDRADGRTLADQRHAEGRSMAEATRDLAPHREVRPLGLHVGHVDGARVEHRATVGRLAVDRNGELAEASAKNRAMMGDEQELVAVAAEDAHVLRLAQARRALRHGVEHGLDVGRRARDNAQDLGGRRLLLQRLGEGGVPGSELAEQPRVLDRDHGLVGERLEQRELGRREPAGLGAGHPDHASDGVPAEHRHVHDRAEPAQLGVLADPRAPGQVGVHVGNVLHHPGQRRPAFGCVLGRRVRRPELGQEGLAAAGQTTPRRDHAEEPAFVPEHRDRPGPEQPHRTVGDGLEDRLDVGGCARDHLQDLAGGGLALQRLGQGAFEAGALRPLLDERGLQSLDQRAELRPIV